MDPYLEFTVMRQENRFNNLSLARALIFGFNSGMGMLYNCRLSHTVSQTIMACCYKNIKGMALALGFAAPYPFHTSTGLQSKSPALQVKSIHGRVTDTNRSMAVRRSANYQPPIWDYDYVQSLSSKYAVYTVAMLCFYLLCYAVVLFRFLC